MDDLAPGTDQETKSSIIVKSRKIYNRLESIIYSSKNFKLIENDRIRDLAKKFGAVKVNEAGFLKAGKAYGGDLFLRMFLSKDPDEYKLTVSLFSIREEKTLFSQTRGFNSNDEAKAIIDSMSEEMFGEKKIDSNFYLAVKICYLHPAQDLADAAYPGPGVSLDFGVENLFFNHFTMAFEAGYFRFSYIENSDDTISFIPLFVLIGYKFYVYDTFFISPVFGSGFNWIFASHGSGKGFSIKENTNTNSLEPAIKAGLEFMYGLSESTSVIFCANYTVVFEKKSFNYLNLNLGIQVKL